MTEEFSSEQVARQDDVDNAIHELINRVSLEPVEWDIEFIGEVRDVIHRWLVDKYGQPAEMFYPFID